MKTAIFDMDGTLLDSMWIWRTVLTEFLEKKNIPDFNDINERVSMMTFTEALAYTAKNYDVGMTGSELKAQLEDYILEIYNTRVTLKPYVREYLEQLKEDGVIICLATLTDRPMVEAVLKRLDIRDYFDYIITVAEIGVTKEHPDIYEACLQFSGAEKSEAIVFEDAAYCLRTAHNAGFTCYGIEDPWQEFPPGFREKYCDRFIKSYKELLKS